MMGKVICLANQKGGGRENDLNKCFGDVSQAPGIRVLCVDFDPQGNLSFSMNADAEHSPTIYDVLKRRVKSQLRFTTRIWWILFLPTCC